VGRAKGVVDVGVCHFGQGGSKFGIVLFLARMVANVFKEEHLAILQCLGGGFDCRPDAVRHKGDRLAKPVAKSRRHRGKGVFRVFLPLGAAKVAAQNHFGTLFYEVLNGRECPHNAGVVRNVTLLIKGHIEIAPHENALAGKVDVFNRFNSSHRTSNLPFPAAADNKKGDKISESLP